MTDNVFNFKSKVSLRKNGAFSFAFAPNWGMLLWASIITIIFAFRLVFMQMAVFLVLFYALFFFVWPQIWSCNVQFDKEEKSLKLHIGNFKEPALQIDVSKVDSCIKGKKRSLKSYTEAPVAVLGTVIGLSALALNFFGAWLFYVALTIGIIILVFYLGIEILPIFGKTTRYTLAYTEVVQDEVKDDSTEKSKDEAAEKKESKPKETNLEFFIAEEDITAFEAFLKDCFKAVGKKELEIVEV